VEEGHPNEESEEKGNPNEEEIIMQPVCHAN